MHNNISTQLLTLTGRDYHNFYQTLLIIYTLIHLLSSLQHPDVCPYQTIDYSVVIELTGVNTSLRGASRIELEFPNRQPPQGKLHTINTHSP